MHFSRYNLVATLAAIVYASPLVSAAEGFAADSNNSAQQQLADASLISGPVSGVSTEAGCKTSCLGNSACTMAVFLPTASQCFLFGPGTDTFAVNQNWISSQKITTAAAAAAAPAAAAQTVDFNPLAASQGNNARHRRDTLIKKRALNRVSQW